MTTMNKKPRNEHTQDEKRVVFRMMAQVFGDAIRAQNYIAAHVVAYSFVEDRVAAMDFVRLKAEGKAWQPRARFWERINRLERAGDLPPDLAEDLRRTGNDRNDLFHAAMWTLSGFTKEAADHVLALGRRADAARKRQQRSLEAT